MLFSPKTLLSGCLEHSILPRVLFSARLKSRPGFVVDYAARHVMHARMSHELVVRQAAHFICSECSEHAENTRSVPTLLLLIVIRICLSQPSPPW